MALSFDGVDQYLSFASLPLDKSDTTWSIGLRFKAGTQPASWARMVSIRDDSDGTQIFANVILGSNGKLNVAIRDSDSVITDFQSASTWDDDGWHWLVVVRNGNSVEIFVDGASDGSGSAAFTGNWSAVDGWEVARDFYANDHEFEGELQDIVCWSKALSLNEIVLAGMRRVAASPDVGCLLLLDEQADGTAHDRSGNGIDGTLVNSPTWVEGYPVSLGAGPLIL